MSHSNSHSAEVQLESRNYWCLVLWSSPLACQPQDARNIVSLPLNRSSQSLAFQVLLRLEVCSFSTMVSSNWTQEHVVTPWVQCFFVGEENQTKPTKPMQNGRYRLIYNNNNNNNNCFNKNIVSPLPCSLLYTVIWIFKFPHISWSDSEKTRDNVCTGH